MKLRCLSVKRKHEWNSVFNQPGVFVLGEAKGVLNIWPIRGLLLKSSYGLQLVTHTETCIAASKFSMLQTILWETTTFGNLWIDLSFWDDADLEMSWFRKEVEPFTIRVNNMPHDCCVAMTKKTRMWNLVQNTKLPISTGEGFFPSAVLRIFRCNH